MSKQNKKAEKYGIRKVAGKSLTGGWVVVVYTKNGATPVAEHAYTEIIANPERNAKTGAEVSRNARAAKLNGAAMKAGQLARAIAAAWTLTESTPGAKCTPIVAKYGAACVDALTKPSTTPAVVTTRKGANKDILTLSRKIEAEYAYKYTLDNWAKAGAANA